MPLPAGQKFGPYEIVALIGAGGMGEVYSARDTRLSRDVAIKVSAERFSERFEREARVIASLNHPNVCTLHDVGPNYLVMELVEGQTLSERIRDGAIPLDEALTIAKQIVEALDAAHQKGIVHRDLKPGNVKIRPDGMVKVLDFGLAKTGGMPGHQSENSPTLTVGQTEAGVILGTAAYMSPEQAKGKPVDKRADIWAFGVVLYEMLTAQRLHQGETLSETLAAVLKETPDLSRVPAQVRPLLRSCLRKDPKQRLHDIADTNLLLEEAGAVEAPRQDAAERGLRRWLWPAVAGISLLTATALGVMLFRQAPPVPQEVRLQIPVPEGLTFNPGTQATISPDARWLAFPAKGSDGLTRYYLRGLDSLVVKPLPGSEVVDLGPPPFWSYDSRYVVYGAAGKLKKSEISGAPAQNIADTDQTVVQGGTWSRDDVILYANNSGNLMQVSANGGTPVAVTVRAPGETAHRWPQFLPDGRRFLYMRVGSPEKTGVYVGSLDVKPEDQNMKPLLPADRQAWWVTSETGRESYLLIQREGTLLAQPFDTATLALSGSAVPVANEVGGYPRATAGLWSVARNGALTYRSGGAGQPQLTWRDLTGKTLGVVGEPDNYVNSSGNTAALSPEGGRLAYAKTDAQGNQDVWVKDLASGNGDIRLTFDPRRDYAPVWSPDGTKIVFAADRGGSMDLYEKNADNSGEERLVLKSDQDKTPTSWSRDGQFLLFESFDPKTAQDLWTLRLSDHMASAFLNTPYSEVFGQFSVDGRWIAYYTRENYQVSVRPFPPEAATTGAAGTQYMVAAAGIYPRWSKDGKSLYYITTAGFLMAVDFQAGASFQRQTPRRVFGEVDSFRPWDATRDDRFLFLTDVAPTGPPPPLTVVLNWMAALKK